MPFAYLRPLEGRSVQSDQNKLCENQHSHRMNISYMLFNVVEQSGRFVSSRDVLHLRLALAGKRTPVHNYTVSNVGQSRNRVSSGFRLQVFM